MRKIKTQEEINKTNKRNQFLVGSVLILLLVVATAGYSFLDKGGQNSDGDKVVENGLEFSRNGEMWNTVIDGVNLQFSYLPSEVENISVNGSYNFGDYASQVIYVSDYNEGAVEILSNLGNFFQRSQVACFNSSDCEEDVPVKTCDDNFIIFQEGENAVYKNKRCVFIVGDTRRAADAFIYKILEINNDK